MHLDIKINKKSKKKQGKVKKLNPLESVNSLQETKALISLLVKKKLKSLIKEPLTYPCKSRIKT